MEIWISKILWLCLLWRLIWIQTHPHLLFFPLLSSLLLPHKSLLDKVEMQTIHQKPFVLFCIQKAKSVPSVLLICFISIFCFLKKGHYMLYLIFQCTDKSFELTSCCQICHSWFFVHAYINDWLFLYLWKVQVGVTLTTLLRFHKVSWDWVFLPITCYWIFPLSPLPPHHAYTFKENFSENHMKVKCNLIATVLGVCVYMYCCI